MTRDDLLALLQSGLKNETIRVPVLSAIRLFDASAQLSITDGRGDPGASRAELLDLYQFRYSRLVKSGVPPPEGLVEFIRSISDNAFDRAWLIIVQNMSAGSYIIDLWVDRYDQPVGCIIGVDQRLLTKGAAEV